MAVDTNSLAYLIDPFWQGEGINGKPLVAGYMCVYIAGTDQKYITWQNWDGTRHPFKIPLGSDGRATILVEVQYTYDCYLYDSFGNLVCSRLNVKPAIGGDVTVYGLTEVWHDSTMSGEGTPQSPLSVVSAGKVYDGIEPIVVNNIENKISAQHIPLGVQEPLYFVQDDEEACIIGMSGGTVDPAEFIPWSASGNFQSAGDYVKHDDLSSYATEDWVEQQSYMHEYMESAFYPMTGNPSGFLTAHQDISNKLDTTAFSTVSGDFITAIPSEYVTENTLQSGLSSKLDSSAFSSVSSTFLTAHQSLDGLMSASLLEQSGGLITGYNGTAFAGQGGGGVTGDFELREGNGIQLTDDPIAHTTTISVSGDYATNTDLQTVSGEITALIPTALTGEYLDKASADTLYYPLNSNPNGYLTAETDWTNTITAASANAYAEATAAIPTGLATEDWVTAQGYLTTAYNPEFAYHDTAISSIDNSALYDNSAHARITTLAGRINTLSSEKLDATASANFLTAVPEGYATEDWVTAQGYLTAHQSLEGYLQDSDLGISDNKITAISGVELSAGGDIPEGVMVESGIEYNSQGYINGYSGSAIATIDQERQWFTHDQTLCHLSNSSQYALGINMSAISADLARMMGVDETVLYSGFKTIGNAGTATYNLNESPVNFNTVKVLWALQSDSPVSGDMSNKGMGSFEFQPDLIVKNFTYIHSVMNGNNSTTAYSIYNVDTNINYIKTDTWDVRSVLRGQTNNGMWFHIYKIIGIGRKS